MTIPREQIERAHIDTLRARQAVAIADDPDSTREKQRHSPHEHLQKTVLGYYESLRSYLVSQPEGKRYYNGAAPDDFDEQGYGVLRRWVREEEVSIDDLPDIPDDVQVLTDEQFYEGAISKQLRDDELLVPPCKIETTDDGRVVRARIAEYQTGLHHLDTLYSRREAVETDTSPAGFAIGMQGASLFGGDDRDDDGEEMRVVLQPLELLMNAARELDRAAAELDLLAQTKESDLKPYMRDFDAANGQSDAEVSQTEVSGTPDM